MPRPIRDPATVARWQADYDAGVPVAQIAERAGVHRTTVNGAIVTTRRTGVRPPVSPQEVVRAMRAVGTVGRAAGRLGISQPQARTALWRAGLTNNPGRRGEPSLDWDTPTTHEGRRWDIEQRIRVRNSRLREMRDSGLTADQIAANTGVDLDIVRQVLRR